MIFDETLKPIYDKIWGHEMTFEKFCKTIRAIADREAKQQVDNYQQIIAKHLGPKG